MKLILVARVSDEEQRGALGGQKLNLERYAEDFDSPTDYYEFDESAFKDGRVKFTKLVEQIKADSATERCIVVFDKIDRLTRDSSQSVVADLKSLVKQDRIELHFPSDNLKIEAGSPAIAWFQLEMGMSLASYYAHSTSDNVRRKFNHMLKNGKWPHRAPLGYKNVRKSKNETTIEIDSERAPYIKQAFEMRARGIPYTVIAKTLKEGGLTSNYPGNGSVCTAYIERLLKNPFYCGWMVHNGKRYRHQYLTIISEELFDQCQDASDKRGGGKATKYASNWFTFKSIARCGKCEKRTMSPYERRGGRYIYLKCPHGCENSNVNERDILPPIEKAIEAVVIPPHFIPKVIKELHETHDTHDQFRAHKIAQVVKRRGQLEESKKRNYDAYVRGGGSITETMFNETAHELDKEMRQLNETYKLLSNADEGLEITQSYLLSLAERMSELFSSSKPELRQRLLKVIVSNIKIADKNITFDVNDPFRDMMEIKKSDPNGSDSSTWRRRGDSNSRYRSPRTNDLANRPLQPLGYSSVHEVTRIT